MLLLKILHAVAGILAAFHAVSALLLSIYWENTQPRHLRPRFRGNGALGNHG